MKSRSIHLNMSKLFPLCMCHQRPFTQDLLSSALLSTVPYSTLLTLLDALLLPSIRSKSTERECFLLLHLICIIRIHIKGQKHCHPFVFRVLYWLKTLSQVLLSSLKAGILKSRQKGHSWNIQSTWVIVRPIHMSFVLICFSFSYH